MATITGTDSGETLNGTPGDDVISLLGGSDFSSAGNGNDSVDGGEGDDGLFGNNGDDTLDGGNGADNLLGGDGNDRLFGGAGNDLLNGGNGDDSLVGGSGSNSFVPGSGNDTIIASGSLDFLSYSGPNGITIGGASASALGPFAATPGPQEAPGDDLIFFINQGPGQGIDSVQQSSGTTLQVFGTDQADLYNQDTLTLGNLTANVGLRYEPLGGDDNIIGATPRLGLTYFLNPTAINVNFQTGTVIAGVNGTDSFTGTPSFSGTPFGDTFTGRSTPPLDESYFFNTGGASHELKFGVGFREAQQADSISLVDAGGGNNTLTGLLASDHSGAPGAITVNPGPNANTLLINNGFGNGVNTVVDAPHIIGTSHGDVFNLSNFLGRLAITPGRLGNTTLNAGPNTFLDLFEVDAPLDIDLTQPEGIVIPTSPGNFLTAKGVNNVILGLHGGNSILGNSNGNFVQVGGGNNNVSLGGGDDYVALSGGLGNNTFDGGAGSDSLHYQLVPDRPWGFNLALPVATITALDNSAVVDTAANFEKFDGGDSEDIFTGKQVVDNGLSFGVQVIIEEEGAPRVDGAGGNDSYSNGIVIDLGPYENVDIQPGAPLGQLLINLGPGNVDTATNILGILLSTPGNSVDLDDGARTILRSAGGNTINLGPTDIFGFNPDQPPAANGPGGKYQFTIPEQGAANVPNALGPDVIQNLMNFIGPANLASDITGNGGDNFLAGGSFADIFNGGPGGDSLLVGNGDTVIIGNDDTVITDSSSSDQGFETNVAIIHVSNDTPSADFELFKLFILTISPTVPGGNQVNPPDLFLGSEPAAEEAAAPGDGSAVGFGEVQVSSASGSTTIFVGTDSVPGADVVYNLDRVYLPQDLAVEVTDTAINISVQPGSSTPVLSVADASVVEGSNNAGGNEVIFTISLSQPSDHEISVLGSTQRGSAAPFADFPEFAATVTFPPGATSATFTVSVLGDTVLEIDEVFFLQLSNPTGGAVISATAGTARGLIIDDDLAPSIDVNGQALNGTTGDDFLVGSAGNDSINGQGGGDTEFGNELNDVLIGGSGNDFILGDFPGNFLDGSADFIDAGEGNDNVFAGGGNDTVFGGPGDDLIGGDFGDNLIFGGDGNNALIGFGGADTIQGGNDGDIVFGLSGPDVISTKGGFDLIIAGGDLDGPTDADFIDVADGGSSVFAGSGDDTILAGEGADFMLGESGADRMSAGGGADIVIAGPGNDTLDGGAGNDVIIPEGGDDSITGGPGADLIRYPSGIAVNADRISDFVSADDTIELGTAFGFANGAAAVAAVAQVGTDAVLTLTGGSITFVGVQASALTAADFVIV